MALPGFLRPSRNRFVFDNLVATKTAWQERSPAGQRPNPLWYAVQAPTNLGTISAPFCTIFSGFAVRFRCLSTTYDHELHQWYKPNVSPLWTLDFGPWTLDLGPWTLDFGPWTLDFSAAIRSYPGLSVIFDFFRVRFLMILPPMILPSRSAAFPFPLTVTTGRD